MAVRDALFTELDFRSSQSKSGLLHYSQTADFQFRGERIVIRQTNGRGIHKPQSLSAALSITTTFTPKGGTAPYEDLEGDDGHLRYKWQRGGASVAGNRSLRNAMQFKLPLVYFVGVQSGVFKALYPVYVIDEEPAIESFVIGFAGSEVGIDLGQLTEVERKYAKREVETRVHQPIFRQMVLNAYINRCAICQIQHVELIDAAHILSDRHPRGHAAVTNGLALCKIHHTSYDRNILGIDGDLTVRIRSDVLAESDGPMLKHGLQEMNGQKLHIPRERSSRPNLEFIDIRFQEFLEAAPSQ
jgi:putative restriction endonuclease